MSRSISDVRVYTCTMSYDGQSAKVIWSLGLSQYQRDRHAHSTMATCESRLSVEPSFGMGVEFVGTLFSYFVEETRFTSNMSVVEKHCKFVLLSAVAVCGGCESVFYCFYLPMHVLLLFIFNPRTSRGVQSWLQTYFSAASETGRNYSRRYEAFLEGLKPSQSVCVYHIQFSLPQLM